MGSENSGGAGRGSTAAERDRERRSRGWTGGSETPEGTQMGSRGVRGESQRGGGGAGGAAAPRGGIDSGDPVTASPIVNPVIINQAPAAPAAPEVPGDQGSEGLGTAGRGGAPRRSLLTLGLAETARKTLLGL